MSVTGNSSKMGRHCSTVILSQIQNTPCRCNGSISDLCHTTQKELQPTFPVPGVTHCLKTLVILGSVRLEEM